MRGSNIFSYSPAAFRKCPWQLLPSFRFIFLVSILTSLCSTWQVPSVLSCAMISATSGAESLVDTSNSMSAIATGLIMANPLCLAGSANGSHYASFGAGCLVIAGINLHRTFSSSGCNKDDILGTVQQRCSHFSRNPWQKALYAACGYRQAIIHSRSHSAIHVPMSPLTYRLVKFCFQVELPTLVYLSLKLALPFLQTSHLPLLIDLHVPLAMSF